MNFKSAIPILYSSSITKSLQYYTEVLGFDRKWEWGTPPTFGGVSRDGVEIFFCEQGQGQPGTWFSLFIDDVDALYDTIQQKGAKVLSAPATMEWNVREMLVEDPDGHKIRFGQQVHKKQSHPGNSLPLTVKLIRREPSVEEFRSLALAVGWSPSMDDEIVQKTVSAPLFSVLAEDSSTGEIIGCALLLGDGASFYYVKDVMVHPDWQQKKIGTALMEALTYWLDAEAANHATVGLYTGETTAHFYEKFGFIPVFGMNRRVRRSDSDK